MKTNLILLLGSTLFFLGMAEFVLRVNISEIQDLQRTLFWSSSVYNTEEDGSIHYLADSEIREVMIYDEEIEYDHLFKTNNYGYADTEKYDPDKDNQTPNYVIVGDSFTVAEGSQPWVPKLRKNLESKFGVRSFSLFNLGLGGAGIEHFYKNLKFFSKKFNIDHIIIVAISDDFHRLMWTPLVKNNEVRFCPEGEALFVCSKRKPIARIIDKMTKSADLIFEASKIRKLEQQKKTRFKEQGFVDERVLRKSRFFGLLYSYLNSEPIFAAGENEQKIGESLLSYLENRNFEVLSKISKDFPQSKIQLIQLPEKSEVISGKYSLDLKNDVLKTGIDYYPALYKCEWTEEMFLPHDPHPNERGYKNIMNCIESHLVSSSF
ncbi:MAG: SGNH/GDSL hydrolase family protein [Bdellovibrionales bacterium]|nr:SGNH/GDSL hydrolase family protein [Bdellovibrionales bacterium]